MIETLHLLPPDVGPRSNPTLFGVAEAIAELFPPVMPTPRACDETSRDARPDEPAGPPAESVGAALA